MASINTKDTPGHNPQFSVSWDSYQSNVCSGFSVFQQNGEFVDMTIATAGYVVKVHKALIALASPYLKEIIQSVSANQHPIIYLNNVDFSTLSELLEYIYTGEVMVPFDHLKKFLETGKSLNIRGLSNLKDIKHRPDTATETPTIVETKNSKPFKKTRSISNNKISSPEPASTLDISNENSTEYYEYYDKAAADMDDSDTEYNQQPQFSPNPTKPAKKIAKKAIETSMQFTVSTRGSLQMILNRYLYNLQWKSRSNTRRWRCVDYRHSRCQAYVITKENTIINRGHLHNHGFHDKKIVTKVACKAVFAEINDVNLVNETKKQVDTEDQLNYSDT